MRGIVYVSRAAVSFDAGALENLAARAAERNQELAVTGYLYYERSRFIQYIEGPLETVEELMSRIERDARHVVAARFHQDDLPERRFPDWHMRRLGPNDMVEIRPETLLSDCLLSSKTSPYDDEALQVRIWRMVDALCRLQARLAHRRARS